jgi:hypothetical protein
MPLIFSPVDLSELRGPFKPRPRSAFLMLQLGGTISAQELHIQRLVERLLSIRGIETVTAAAVRGTGDYLQKIVDLIRSCGFCFAIFSDLTPARSLANIFFEVGVAGVLGKPVQLLLAGPAPPPSDFVRTEWIRYSDTHEILFEAQLTQALGEIEAGAEFYRKIGLIALGADEPDLEEAFERLKQAILISDDHEARGGLSELRDRLVSRRGRGHLAGDLASHRNRLLKAVTEFLALLPPQKRARSVRGNVGRRSRVG